MVHDVCQVCIAWLLGGCTGVNSGGRLETDQSHPTSATISSIRDLRLAQLPISSLLIDFDTHFTASPVTATFEAIDAKYSAMVDESRCDLIYSRPLGPSSDQVTPCNLMRCRGIVPRQIHRCSRSDRSSRLHLLFCSASLKRWHCLDEDLKLHFLLSFFAKIRQALTDRETLQQLACIRYPNSIIQTDFIMAFLERLRWPTKVAVARGEYEPTEDREHLVSKEGSDTSLEDQHRALLASHRRLKLWLRGLSVALVFACIALAIGLFHTGKTSFQKKVLSPIPESACSHIPPIPPPD